MTHQAAVAGSSAFATNDEKWAAVVRRDPSADGQFYLSVRSTGIYCRPNCPARLPRREHAAFHDTCADAERAGFRACKRCRPNETSAAERRAAAVTAGCRLIESAEEMPALDDLAAAAGMSRFHFHRIFKQATGVTPKAYAAAHRNGRVARELTRSATVTEAIYDGGFNSSGRFYADAAMRLGMTPTAYRAGGRGTRIRFAVGTCSLGAILVAASTVGVCAVLLGDEPVDLVRDVQDRFPEAELVGGEADFEAWMAQVIGFIDTPGVSLDLPLDIRGTAFQERVWRALREIPPGVTLSYGQLAERIGASRAVRAVARACAANPIAVAIPCHRVVRADGSLSGYRWGLDRKRALLERETARTRG